MLHTRDKQNSSVKLITEEEVTAITERLKELEYDWWKKTGPALFISLDKEMIGDIDTIDAELVPLFLNWIKDILWCSESYRIFNDEEDLIWARDSLLIEGNGKTYYYNGLQRTLMIDVNDKELLVNTVKTTNQLKDIGSIRRIFFLVN